jgi:PKD repeat protein
MATGCDSIVTTVLSVINKPATPVITIIGNVLKSDVPTGNQWYSLGWGAYADSINQTFSAHNDEKYFVLVTTEGCTSDTSNIIEYIQRGIKADFAYSVNNKTLTIADSSTGNVGSWYWKYGDGTLAIGQNVTHTYSTLGTYNVCLTVLDKTNKVSDKACKNVTIGAVTCNLTAGFSYDVLNMTLRLKNESLGNPTQSYWNFDDGKTSANQNPVHNYTESGFYAVTLSISNQNNSCSDSHIEIVQIGQITCHADFDFTTDAINHRKATFINNSEGVLTNYYWDFNDGTSSVLKSPVHNFNKDGIYNVTLTVASNNFSCMDNIVIPVAIGTVTCSAAFSNYVDSATNTAYFKEDALGEQSSVLWNFGDGVVSTKHNPTHVYLNSGYYTVSLSSYKQSSNCMDYFETDIIVGNEGSGIRAGFTYVADSVNRIINFTDQSKGNIVSYVWNFGDGAINSSNDPNHTYNKPGYYNVCLFVADSKGNSDILCKKVGLATGSIIGCQADFAFSIDSATRTASFVDKSLGSPSKWEWAYGDNVTGSLQNTTHKYSKNDYYLVSLKTTNSSNCVSKTYKLLSINKSEGLKIEFGFDPKLFNAKAGGYPVDFIGAGLGDQTRLKWTFGDNSSDSTTMSPTHIYQNAGKYYVCYIVTDAVTGQADTACQEVSTTDIISVNNMLVQGNRMIVYPNPFSSSTMIKYELDKNTSFELAVYDFSGRKIKTLEKLTQDKGTYAINWDAQDIEPGSYLLQLKTSDGTTKSLMLVKQR